MPTVKKERSDSATSSGSAHFAGLAAAKRTESPSGRIHTITGAAGKSILSVTFVTMRRSADDPISRLVLMTIQETITIVDIAAEEKNFGAKNIKSEGTPRLEQNAKTVALSFVQPLTTFLTDDIIEKDSRALIAANCAGEWWRKLIPS
jgi:glycine/serine hydroxymethyltransferase